MASRTGEVIREGGPSMIEIARVIEEGGGLRREGGDFRNLGADSQEGS